MAFGPVPAALMVARLATIFSTSARADASCGVVAVAVAVNCTLAPNFTPALEDRIFFARPATIPPMPCPGVEETAPAGISEPSEARLTDQASSVVLSV